METRSACWAEIQLEVQNKPLPLSRFVSLLLLMGNIKVGTEQRRKSAGEHELVPFLGSPEAASPCCRGRLWGGGGEGGRGGGGWEYCSGVGAGRCVGRALVLRCVYQAALEMLWNSRASLKARRSGAWPVWYRTRTAGLRQPGQRGGLEQSRVLWGSGERSPSSGDKALVRNSLRSMGLTEPWLLWEWGCCSDVGFKHSKTVLPSTWRLQRAQLPVLCVAVPAEEVWEGDPGMPVWAGRGRGRAAHLLSSLSHCSVGQSLQQVTGWAAATPAVTSSLEVMLGCPQKGLGSCHEVSVWNKAWPSRAPGVLWFLMDVAPSPRSLGWWLPALVCRAC